MHAPAITSHSSSKGFTLVEMLMAMLIMTVGLLGLLQSVNVAYQHSLKDRLRKEATLLTEVKMHDWCRLPFKDISSSAPKDEAKVVAGVPWHYRVSREMQPVGTGTKKLRVGMTWTIKGAYNSHEIFALRTRRDGE
jgi:type IV pilus assembly protein PilV